MGKKRLNQIVAIERDIKTRSYKDLTKEHHLLQRADVVAGHTRTYRPKEDGGETLPAESKHVAMRVSDALAEIRVRQRELYDITLTKDVGNTQTLGDVLDTDGKVILKDVPVPTLLFLEKSLGDLHTFVEKLPTLDPNQRWTFDATQGCYVTAPVETIRTKKVKKGIVLYPHSDKHPAQTQLIDEDITAGIWTQINLSGAIPTDERRKLLDRVDTLSKAVKEARERANLVEVEERKMGDTVFNFIFGGNS